MKTLATIVAPYPSGVDAATFDAALKALRQHDVVLWENGRCRYSVALLRRWVQGLA